MTKTTVKSKLTALPLVGGVLTKAFSRIGITSIEDLLYFFPTRYVDFRKTVNIASAVEGQTITVIGSIKNVRSSYFRSRMSYSEITIEDGTGMIKAIWFNQPYISKHLKIGDEIIVSGKISKYKGLQFSNPSYELLENTTGLHTGRLVPVYKRTDLIPLRTLRKIMNMGLMYADQLEDVLPEKLAKQFNAPSISEAVRWLHFPQTEEQVNSGRFRLALDDILPQQLAVELRRKRESKIAGFKVKPNIEEIKSFLKTLPFGLTPSQKRATWDILQDLEAGKPMNRLLQGDVGSGKTIVAMLACLEVARAGFQTAVLAPTEILAKQHYDTFRETFKNEKGFRVALLTRTFALLNGKEVTKEKLNEEIRKGKLQVCIGTHAVLQGKTSFKHLALVVIDEQHRFGVAQRSFLLGGFSNNQTTSTTKTKALKSPNITQTPATIKPHLLSMSATPIPRTLAMSLYADLEVSTLGHVPTGRKPISTEIVSEKNRKLAYEFIDREAGAGRQAFIVTPRVEESEAKVSENDSTETTSEIKSVKKEFKRLQKDIFPHRKLGLLYGKMKGSEKEKVMADFASGKLDILVATSVIEIGIDIPKATAMIIEGSERFGLAQLHQLRGRIGRNSFESKCFLFTTEESQQETKRLTSLTKINDGFALAEIDLAERGFGDLFGKQQSGFMFRFPGFISIQALKTAREIAKILFIQDPNLTKFKTLKKQAELYLKEIHGE